MTSIETGDTAAVERMAGTISQRAAELLRTQISVTDRHGAVLASRAPDQAPPPTAGDADRGPGVIAPDAIRVPLRLDEFARLGEVIVAPPPAGEEAIPPRLARALVDLVVNQVAVVDRLPNGVELKNKLIYDLLHGTTDQGRILREAKLLGMDLTPPRAVILIDAAEFVRGTADPRAEPRFGPTEMGRRSQLLIGSVVGFFLLPDETICAASGDGEVAVLKASDSKNLESWVDEDDDPEPPSASWANLNALKRAGQALLVRLRHDTGGRFGVNVGIGRYHPGVRGLSRSYGDARAALSLGRRFHGQNRVHCLDGLGIAAFVGLADERTKVDLATHLLSPLDHEPDLIETLRVFFEEDRCPSAAAARLAVHRNTLGYRLEKVATLSGLDPRRFDDAVQIRLALVLRSLAAAA